MATEICNTSLPASGNPCCSDRNPFGAITSLFFTTSDFEFASTADFADEDEWLAGISSGDIMPITDAWEFESQDEETKYFDSALGNRLKLRDGKYRSMHRFQLPFEVHKKLQALSNQKVRLFKADINGNVYGTSSDGVAVNGFELDLVNVEKMKFGTADTPAWTVILTQEKYPNEWNTNGVTVNPTESSIVWNPSALTGVIPTIITFISKSTFYLTVSVSVDCGIDNDGNSLDILLEGLLDVNFESISPQSVIGMTEIGNGVYEVEGDLAWLSGHKLKNVSTLSNLYQSNIITLT